ncbi:MAG: NADPH-dependent FMN reductase [Thermoplasmata archaeon]
MAFFLPILYGSVREGRRSFAVAEYAEQRMKLRPGIETHLYDARDLPFGNLVQREWEMDPVPPAVTAFVGEMGRADGFLIVTPEYNYGYPGALKNLLDHLWEEWNRKPFALVTAGGISGGLRCADQLRQVISGLGAIVVPRHLSIPEVGDTFGPNGPRAGTPEFDRRLDGVLEELEWYARALARARAGGGST